MAGYELVGESSADGSAARAGARVGLILLLVAAAREQLLGKGAGALPETRGGQRGCRSLERCETTCPENFALLKTGA